MSSCVIKHGMGKKKVFFSLMDYWCLNYLVFRKQPDVPKLPNKRFVQFILLIFLISSTQKPAFASCGIPDGFELAWIDFPNSLQKDLCFED